MPVNKPHIYDRGIYFISFTNYQWLPLFAITDAYDLVYKWFDHLASNGHVVVAYVIMPNHIHIMVARTQNKPSLNTIIGNGKRFLAYGIIQRLEAAKKHELLSTLSNAVTNSERKRGKLHEVFQPSFDIKRCDSIKFLYQKLEYIHNNPIVKKWELAKKRSEYKHSSAKFYDTDEQSMYLVRDLNEYIEKWEELFVESLSGDSTET